MNCENGKCIINDNTLSEKDDFSEIEIDNLGRINLSVLIKKIWPDDIEFQDYILNSAKLQFGSDKVDHYSLWNKLEYWCDCCEKHSNQLQQFQKFREENEEYFNILSEEATQEYLKMENCVGRDYEVENERECKLDEVVDIDEITPYIWDNKIYSRYMREFALRYLKTTKVKLSKIWYYLSLWSCPYNNPEINKQLQDFEVKYKDVNSGLMKKVKLDHFVDSISSKFDELNDIYLGLDEDEKIYFRNEVDELVKLIN